MGGGGGGKTVRQTEDSEKERNKQTKQKTKEREKERNNYNNADVEILWDCTISTDSRLEEEGNRPDLVVTDRREKEINVVVVSKLVK